MDNKFASSLMQKILAMTNGKMGEHGPWNSDAQK